jgi:hypothetical protein
MGEIVQIVRVVLASPGDVDSERDVVVSIFDELNRSVAADRGLRLEAARWETDAYPGFHPDGPQALIDSMLQIEDADLLVGIFWKRFGTPTRDASSGTEHEFRLAYKAWKETGRPQIMMYFNQKAYTPRSKEETDQWGRVLEFQSTFPKEGLWCPYKGKQFERLVRTHLTNFVRALASTKFDAPRAFKSADYFAIQNEIIEDHSRTFLGRLQARRAYEEFLRTNSRGYFIVIGAPGQGKTAFASQVAHENNSIHHFVSPKGPRADARLILRSLLSQIISLTGSQSDIPESIEELAKVWEELLLAAAQRRPLTIVIDGLDELPQTSLGELPYLTVHSLPQRIYFLVTIRPGERLSELQALLSRLPSRTYKLEPLDRSDIEALVRSSAPTVSDLQLATIVERSQGNPLYVTSVVKELRNNAAYDLNTLPRDIEGFFRDATAAVRENRNKTLRDVLGLLAVARKALGLAELEQIIRIGQHELFDQGVVPIRNYLVESNGTFSFYHSSFHEYVTRKLLYEDELREFHARTASWLESDEREEVDYRWESMAYHLFEAGERDRLLKAISPEFLLKKGRRLGYGVLEDLGLVSQVLLQTGDPSSIERCISLVEALRVTLGENIIREATRALKARQGMHPTASSLKTPVSPRVPVVPGMDMYIGAIPARDVTADFFEVVPGPTRLTLAIGDAPSSGLKSAFVARFIGNLFRNLIQKQYKPDLGTVLGEINSTLAPFDYFERVSMQCVDLDPAAGLCHIANAGHPSLVLYSERRKKSDVLPVPGDLLRDPFRQTKQASAYEQYSAEVSPGDVLILLTDGLTEAHRLDGHAYGYRFTRIVEENSALTAKQIGQAILEDWRAHREAEAYSDDLTVVVVKFAHTKPTPGSGDNF